jgi:hypothetical protein
MKRELYDLTGCLSIRELSSNKKLPDLLSRLEREVFAIEREIEKEMPRPL